MRIIGIEKGRNECGAIMAIKLRSAPPGPLSSKPSQSFLKVDKIGGMIKIVWMEEMEAFSEKRGLLGIQFYLEPSMKLHMKPCFYPRLRGALSTSRGNSKEPFMKCFNTWNLIFVWERSYQPLLEIHSRDTLLQPHQQCWSQHQSFGKRKISQMKIQ